MGSVSIIAAMTDDRVIGRNNQLPWHLPDDLKRFKALTLGHPIIMGRKTFESIGKPLPGRDNYVVSARKDFSPAGVIVADSLTRALDDAWKKNSEAFVIGGASLFEQALPLANKIYFTLIHEKIAGDVHFPSYDWAKDFKIVEQSQHEAMQGQKLKYSFITAVRNGHR